MVGELRARDLELVEFMDLDTGERLLAIDLETAEFIWEDDQEMAEKLRAIDLEIAELMELGLGTTLDLKEARRRKLEKDIWPIPPWLLEKPFLGLKKFMIWMETKLDYGRNQPRRRKVWGVLGVCSWGFTFCCGEDLGYKYDRSLPMIWLHFFYFLSIFFGYPILLFCLYNVRDPLHYVLRRSHKQLLESALVLVSSSWVYYTTDYPIDLSTTVPSLCLGVIPCLNLWWDFDNFGFFDSCLLVLIVAALLFCRDRGVVALMVVTVVGLALQFIKNAYRQYCSDKIKNQTLDHLV